MAAHWVALAVLSAGTAPGYVAGNAFLLKADPAYSTQSTPAARNLAGGNDDPRFTLVQRHLRESQYLEGQQVAQAILASNPASARAIFYVGLALHKQKKYAPARPLLESAAVRVAEFAEGPHAIHFVGWCAYYLGDLVGARRAFELHRAKFPAYDDTHFGIGLVALDEDKLDEAEACFRKALELLAQSKGLTREFAKNYARLGDVELRRDELVKAEENYRKAVQLWRDHYEAWAKLARALDRQGKNEEAAEARQQHDEALKRLSEGGIPWRP